MGHKIYIYLIANEHFRITSSIFKSLEFVERNIPICLEYFPGFVQKYLKILLPISNLPFYFILPCINCHFRLLNDCLLVLLLRSVVLRVSTHSGSGTKNHPNAAGCCSHIGLNYAGCLL